MLAAAPALADQYQVTFGWTDPTTYNAEDVPEYEARYRVAGGAETTLAGLTTPGGAVDLTAAPGDPIEVEEEKPLDPADAAKGGKSDEEDAE